MKRAVVLLAVVFVLGCPMPDGMRVHAGCPKVFVKKQAVALVQYVPAYVPQYYQVGAAVQQEALIEAAVARAFGRFQATITKTETRTEISSGQATIQAQATTAGTFGRCAKCHTGENRTGFRVDVALSCEDRLRAIGMLLHDDDSKRMPKGVQLPADELGTLIQAFSSNLPARAAVPPREPQPPATRGE